MPSPTKVKKAIKKVRMTMIMMMKKKVIMMIKNKRFIKIMKVNNWKKIKK